MTGAQAKTQLRSDSFNDVRTIVQEALAEGAFPGAVLLVGSGGEVQFCESFGTMSYPGSEGDPPPLPMRKDTVFDLAALTNIVVTATLCMRLVETQKIRLDDRASRCIQGFSVYGKSAITIEHLLSHTSGLAHWHPYFEELIKAHSGSRIGILTSRGARDYVVNSINRSHLKYEPGTKQVYSDVGFMLLGQVIETLTGLTLDKAAFQYIFHPLGLRSTSFIDLAMIKRRGIHPVTDIIAPTEECPWRKRVLCGEVHDDNAWAMGGIAGHAGLFSSAADLHRFAAELICAYHGQSEFLSAETVRRFWSFPQGRESGWKLGWETPGKDNGLQDSKLGARAVGHSGFTGCSLWIEPELGIDIVLLTNRIHPSRSNKKIYALRPALYDAAIEAALRS